jgi:hypothetical protein
MEPISRRVALAGAAAVALVGCTAAPEPSTEAPATQPTPEPTLTPNETPLPTEWIDDTPRWPLTGVPLKEGEEEKAAHAVVAVKIGQEPSSQPEYGLAEADLVICESQGRSYDTTRLCAMYHSKYPPNGAQPIRSCRPVDYTLVAPTKGVLFSSGAVDWVIRYMKAHSKQLTYVDTGSRGYFTSRSPGGWWYGANVSWKTVVALPKQLVKAAKLNKGKVPPVYLQYAQTDDEVSTLTGADASKVQITYTNTTHLTEKHRYVYDAKSGKWKKSIKWNPPWPGVSGVSADWHAWKDRSGKQVAPDNVLIIVANWAMGVVKGYGTAHREPLYKIDGKSGHFFYLHAGKVVEGTWSKEKASAPFRFKLDDGTFLKMAPGQTWIELPKNSRSVKVS